MMSRCMPMVVVAITMAARTQTSTAFQALPAAIPEFRTGRTIGGSNAGAGGVLPSWSLRLHIAQDDSTCRGRALSGPVSTQSMRSSRKNFALEMKKRQKYQQDESEQRRLRKTDLNAVSVDYDIKDKRSVLQSTILPVLSTSLLITGNTLGASMLVLPDLAVGPEMSLSAAVFAGSYLMNLLSGLVVADIAIQQHEQSGDDVPSSFKAFADATLPSAAHIVAGLSIFVNALMLAFNTIKVGDLSQSVFDVGFGSAAWAAAGLLLLGTQTIERLSDWTAWLVLGLFATLSALLVPGLAHVSPDVIERFGTSLEPASSAGQLAPVVLMSLVYQNIVPTVTKLLDYDRAKTTAALSLGSFLPLLVYVLWTLAVVGGGMDECSAAIMNTFAYTTIAGSSIGCFMSLSEEFEGLGLATKDPQDGKFSLPAVLASAAVSFAAMQWFGRPDGDLNAALEVAGAYGSPLLYGAIPVAMAYTQRNREQHGYPTTSSKHMIPAPVLSFLGLTSAGYVGSQLLQVLPPEAAAALGM